VDLKRIISEIQRRRVGRVAGVYAVVGWVVIQVVATVFPLLEISDVFARIVVLLIALGFPVAIALAWFFDVTPEGLQRTESLPESAPPLRADLRSYGRGLGLFGVGILVSLVAFAALSRVRSDRDEKTAAGIRSIGVLPFVDLSERRDQSYFTDGISEEVLNRLAQIPDLRVPARTSSFAYRGSTLEVSDIGRRLKVESLLEGSVRREGNSVRVTVRLIDVHGQDELWSNEYEKTISSVFAIQDEIATDIVNALKLQINPQPVVNGAVSRTLNADPAAVDDYMKGLDFFNKRTDPTLRRAIGYLERAVAKDPDFALGFAMLAQAYAVLPAYGNYPVFEASTKGQAASARALQLNPSQPEAYAALGQIRQNFEWDFESAERSYRRAILFNNGYATAHQWRAEALLFLGQFEESRKEVDNALDLDPASSAALHVKAYQHIARREFAPANRILDRILAANPEYPLALISKASVALMTQQFDVAQSMLQRLAGNDRAFAATLEAVVNAARDPKARPAAAAALAEQKGKRSASELALWYALAGLQDQAFANIKAAYDSGADVNLPFILLHPALDGIRAEKDFQAILSDLHMSPSSTKG
jgi:TolB-like protein/tetratricopeptide (TPR) repeat protein